MIETQDCRQVVGAELSTSGLQLRVTVPRGGLGTRGLSLPFLRGAPGGELLEKVVPQKAKRDSKRATGAWMLGQPYHVPLSDLAP